MEYRSLFSALSARCHSASISRTRSLSKRLIILMQSVRWMDTPLPLVTKPTISSPGTGLQHLEKRTATSWMPLTTIPLLDFFAAGTLLVISSRPFRMFASVTSRLSFLFRASSILLMTWPSLRPPWPMEARTESQSLKAYRFITFSINSGLFRSG